MKKELRWKELPMGGIIDEPGNAVEYNTGSWRTYRPIFYEDRCVHCFMCWVYCPDNAVLAKDGKIIGINLHHCKGCGICMEECPDKANAIEMKLETDCVSSDK